MKNALKKALTSKQKVGRKKVRELVVLALQESLSNHQENTKEHIKITSKIKELTKE